MKNFSLLLTIPLCSFLLASLQAQVPSLLNYQGRVLVGNTNFEGAGQFKFALVSAGTEVSRPATVGAVTVFLGKIVQITIADGGFGYTSAPEVTINSAAGTGAVLQAVVSNLAVVRVEINDIQLHNDYPPSTTITIAPPPPYYEVETYWSNDSTSVDGAEPSQAVALPVQRGIYSVLLGDTLLPNMNPITVDVFRHPDAHLRVWFNNGLDGFQLLTPDQRVAAVGYAMMAAAVPEGAISSAMLGAGTVTSAKLATGAVNSNAIALGSITSELIANGTLTDINISDNAAINAAKISGGDLQASRLKVGSAHTLSTGAELATIGGGRNNSATSSYAVIGGGRDNIASQSYSVVAGGTRNAVSSSYGTVSGGRDNAAGALDATVGGGKNNAASATCSTIAGGDFNEASNEYATVPGGRSNRASGRYSHAAGYQARAAHDGTFVWADSTTAPISSTASNQFIVRASGGIWLGANSSPALPAGQFLSTSTGAYLSSGGAWMNNSDRETKENLAPVDKQQVLKRVAEMPITTWNYRVEGESVQHLGPMAQDFHAAFQLGSDERHIAALDSAGVALAAIQGLHEMVEEKDARIAGLEKSVEELKALLLEIQKRQP